MSLRINRPRVALLRGLAATLIISAHLAAVPALAQTAATLITTQPVSRVATAGTSASFSVAATPGAGPLQYQWRRNGFTLAGATHSTLTLPAVGRSDIDFYDVRVTDGLSVTTSARARLDVSPTATPQAFGLDPAFDLSFEAPGGSVSRLVRAPDGKILIAGNFLHYEGTTTPNLARLLADGTVDPTFVGTTFDAPVRDVAVQADGKILVFGNFTRVGSLARSGVARLLADGTPDAAFTLGPSLVIRTLSATLLQADGKILVAGDLTATVGTTARTHLVRLLADGTLDTLYNPAPGAAVVSLALQPDGKLLVAGSFIGIAGSTRRYLVRLNPDGTDDTSFNLGSGPAGPIYVVRLDSTGRVLVSGASAQFNGTPAPGLLRLLPDGTRDTTFVGVNATSSIFGSGTTPPDGSIRDLTVLPDGKIAIVGYFQFLNGGFVSGNYGFERLNADGSPDRTFSPDQFIAGGVTSVLALPDSRILLGGDFGAFTFATPLYGVAAFTSAGRLDPSIKSTLATGNVNALASVAGGKILVAGDFTHVNGQRRSHLVRLLADGSLDSSFTATLDQGIGWLAVQGDGRIVISGAFTRVDSIARARLARLNADGTLDSTFDFRDSNLFSTTSSSFSVSALAEGRVLLARVFANIVTPNIRAFARLTATGSLDTSYFPFEGTTGSTGLFSAYAVLPDERLLHANDGSSSSNGIKPAVLTRLSPDGRVDSAFTPGIVPALGSGLRALALLPDGKFLIGGSFTTYNGATRSRIARLNPDGTLDPTFTPPSTPTNNVVGLLPAGTGSTYVFRTGPTSQSQAPLATALTRLNADGTADTGFVLTFTASATLFPASLVLDDGNLLLAGETFTENSVTRRGLMRTRAHSGVFFIAQPVARTVSAGASPVLSVAVGGSTAVTYQWFKDGALVAGATRSSYALTAVQTTAAGSYFVRVTHTGGTLDSTSVTVTVNDSAPVFASTVPTPVGLGSTMLAGTRFALTAPTVSAGTAPLTCQWSRDGVDLPGETGTALFRAAWSPADSGSYQVTVSNSLGTVSSVPLLQNVAVTPDWAWASPRPQGNSPAAISYVNHTFFASAARGTLLRSTNGFDWTALRLGTSSPVSPVVFGNGRYVVLVQFGGIYSSEDGLTWTARESGLTDGRSVSRLVFGNGRFVASGALGALRTSTDGITWTAATFPVADASTYIAYGAGRWLALSSQGDVFTSTDGVTWSTRSALPETSLFLAFGAGLFCTISLDASTIHTSPDGLTWTRRATNASSTAGPIDLTYADATFFVPLATSAGRYLTSADGVSWHEIAPTPSLSTASHTLTRGEGLYLQAAAAPDLLRWSQDGVFWSRIAPAEGRSFRGIAANGTVAVAVGTAQPPLGTSLTALLSISYDGTTWFPASSGFSGALNDVAWGGAPASQFVAVGAGSNLLTSPDGITWTTRTATGATNLRGVKHVNGRWIAVGDNAMFTSTNALTWTRVTLPGTAPLYQVAYGSGAYVAVGATGAILRSTDAVTWITRPSSTVATLVDVVFAAGKFVAVASNGEIVTSPDGLTWTSRLSRATALANIAFAGGQFLALSSGSGYSTSPDGETWTPAQHGSALALADLVEFQNRLVGVGNFGSVLTQPLPAPAGTTPPVIAAQPATSTARTGQSLTLSATASGSPAPTYQWLKNAVPIPGATHATLVLDALRFTDAGTYAVVATNSAGAETSNPATLTVAPAAQLSNLSVRTTLATAQTLTVGLTLGGNGSSQWILVRAAGPALSTLGVPGAMADPKLELFSRSQKISENNDWNDLTGVYAADSLDFARVGAFAFLPGSKDAALQRPLSDSTTVVASGTGPGTLLVECYDTQLTRAGPTRLTNLSARNHVGTGSDILIAGLNISGTGSLRLLIRGIGPTLSAFGVTAPLTNPHVAIFDSTGALLAENDDWSATLAPTFASVGAFALPASSRDAALVATLPAGRSYTVQVSGASNTTGEALVEIYELP